MPEASAALAKKREIKVQIPVSLVLQLQTLKIARGILIADVVEEALRAYFARKEHEEPPTEAATSEAA